MSNDKLKELLDWVRTNSYFSNSVVLYTNISYDNEYIVFTPDLEEKIQSLIDQPQVTEWNKNIDEAPYNKPIICIISRHEGIKLPMHEDVFCVMHRKKYSHALDDGREFYAVDDKLNWWLGGKSNKFCWYVRAWRHLLPLEKQHEL